MMHDGEARDERGSALFDGSYLSVLSNTWAKQQLGLIWFSQLANHISTSFNYLTYNPKGVAVDEDDGGFDEGDWDLG